MIEYYVKQTLFGIFKLGVDENSIVYLKITYENESKFFSYFAKNVFTQLDEYFRGIRQSIDIPLKLKGTDFQIKVWNALLSVPYGETRSYKDIALLAGNSKAVRAVGTACKNNPVWIIVPCHRIILSNGEVSGYAGGIKMKHDLLQLENYFK